MLPALKERLTMITSNDIRNRKIALGITTAELAYLAELPIGTVSKIITGETKNPKLLTIEKLDSALTKEESRRRISAYLQAMKDYYEAHPEAMGEIDKFCGSNSSKHRGIPSHNQLFEVDDYKKIRVIIDTDAACEADDPFAIVHALLSQKLIVKGITAAHFNCEGSVERSYAEIETILNAMNMDVPHFMGEKEPLNTGKITSDQATSDAVNFIIDEALSDDPHPLYILCQGAITNLAVAILKCPEIVGRINVIWIGTHGELEEIPYREFNAGNDVKAANVVLSSGVNLSLVPSTVYSTVNIGIAELQTEVYPYGAIGRHLFEQLVAYNNSEAAEWTKGESWSLGDSPAVAIALNPWCGHYKQIGAPIIGEDTSSTFVDGRPLITIYTDIDSRYILGDMIAKIKLFAM